MRDTLTDIEVITKGVDRPLTFPFNKSLSSITMASVMARNRNSDANCRIGCRPARPTKGVLARNRLIGHMDGPFGFRSDQIRERTSHKVCRRPVIRISSELPFTPINTVLAVQKKKVTHKKLPSMKLGHRLTEA